MIIYKRLYPDVVFWKYMCTCDESKVIMFVFEDYDNKLQTVHGSYRPQRMFIECCAKAGYVEALSVDDPEYKLVRLLLV